MTRTSMVGVAINIRPRNGWVQIGTDQMKNIQREGEGKNDKVVVHIWLTFVWMYNSSVNMLYLWLVHNTIHVLSSESFQIGLYFDLEWNNNNMKNFLYIRRLQS